MGIFPLISNIIIDCKISFFLLDIKNYTALLNFNIYKKVVISAEVIFVSII